MGNQLALAVEMEFVLLRTCIFWRCYGALISTTKVNLAILFKYLVHYCLYRLHKLGN